MTSEQARNSTKYLQMQAAQKKKIIRVAFNLFITRSFNEVSMKDIAGKARISRQTLYKYYRTIDEVIFAIEVAITNELATALAVDVAPTENGLKAALQLQQEIFDYGRQHPDYFYFLSLFQNYNRNRPIDDPLNQEFRNDIETIYLPFDFIHKGQEDGSIRSDLDSKAVAYLLFNQTAGLALRLATLGNQSLPADHSVTVVELESLFLQFVEEELAPRK